MELVEITESVFTEQSLDASNRIIRNVAIMGSNISKNNRKYSDKAMSQIATLTNSAKCFIDHNESQVKAGRVRSMRDFCGQFANAKYQNNKVSADLKTTSSHYQMFADLAEMESTCGMSVAIRCRGGKDADGVER